MFTRANNANYVALYNEYMFNSKLRTWLVNGSSIDIYLSGLLARRQNAWSQDGGNMRVIANGVNC